MIKRIGQGTKVRPFWREWNSYAAITGGIAGLLTLFFLLATIMPITLYQTLEGFFWELKTFATSYRPLAALIGLILFLISGGTFVRIVRGSQIWGRPRRQTRKLVSSASQLAGKVPDQATVSPAANVSTQVSEKPTISPLPPAGSVQAVPASSGITAKTSTPPTTPEGERPNVPGEMS